MASPDSHPSLVDIIRPKLVPCRIREFHSDDLTACLNIHRSNEPDLVNPAALDKFVEFLAQGTSYLLVVEKDGQVIACAGLELVGDSNAAKLLHAMVHRDFQHQGIGTTLLAARLSLLEPEDDEPIDVLLRARPAAAGFYGAFGFAMHTLDKDNASAVLSLAVTPEDIASLRAELAGRGIEVELNPLPDSSMEEALDSE